MGRPFPARPRAMHGATGSVCRDEIDQLAGTPSTHPIHGEELRALRRLERESPASPFVFVSERGSPFTTAGFARMIDITNFYDEWRVLCRVTIAANA